MTRFSMRWVAVVVSLVVVAAAKPAKAQDYFGRNKVQYEQFDWRIIKSDHFDDYFYPPESLAVSDAARMAERWYVRHSDTFRHAFDHKSLIFYADHPDFEQTNVTPEQLDEAIGGETEGMRDRVIMPFTGVYSDNNHVLGHEMVHVFQYNIAEAAPGGGLQRMATLPGWLIEGMAEYLSLGRDDPLTAMWMRDAVLRNKFPTIKQVTDDPHYFPYRYGQALWAYIGGRWGDRAIVDVFRTSLRMGWNDALVRVLGESDDSLSKDWAAANRALYLPQIQGRTNPDSIGTKIIGIKLSGDNNLAPTLSPDGKYFAFFSSRDIFGINLYLADARTGKVIRQLASPQSDRHYDAIASLNAAGDWSPDATHFAFIVNTQGNEVIGIVDVNSPGRQQTIPLPGVGAVQQLTWSPDGKTIAFSGLHGGVSDLFLMDVQTHALKEITNDRYADIEPTWSPDGRSLAFVTDRGPGTNFETMTFAPLRLGIIDIATDSITLIQPFPRGMTINPQYSTDGTSLFFISNQDGFADIYRMSLADHQTYRLTHVSTGISGVTTESPAFSVARKTGEMLFSSFYNQGEEVRAFSPAETQGVLMTQDSVIAVAANGSTLPPAGVTNSLISEHLADATTGLPSGADFTVGPYKSRYSLDAIAQPEAGVGVGGPFGTMFQGGIAALFGDQLSDKQIYTAIQANGTVKDIGGLVEYMNLQHRWNYFATVGHIPYLTGGVFLQDTVTAFGDGYNVNQLLQRVYVDQASLAAQYPLNASQRIELSGDVTRLGYSTQLLQTTVVNNSVVSEQVINNPQGLAFGNYKSMFYAEPSAAFVGDNSFAAFVSPVSGTRYRFQATPTFGNIQYQTLLADYRKYFFMRPLTFAIRGMSLGRYGKDAENPNLYPLYLGEETWIRGYGVGSFTGDECQTTSTSNPQSCPAFERLLGSKVMVANAEFRIPLFGVEQFGLINFPFLPTELAPFFDAGLAYTNTQHPDFRIARNDDQVPASCDVASGAQAQLNGIYGCADRIPVFSTGLSMRFNVFGVMILEAYVAHPFQRPNKNWVWGFQMAPGW